MFFVDVCFSFFWCDACVREGMFSFSNGDVCVARECMGFFLIG